MSAGEISFKQNKFWAPGSVVGAYFMRDLLKTISKKEWRFFWIVAIFFLLITMLPVVLGYFLTPTNHTYLGLHFFSPVDYFVYYSYIQQIKEGQFLLFNLFSMEPDFGTLNIFWLFLGLIARFLKLPVIFIFHFSRIFFIILLCWVLFFITCYFFKESAKRKIVFLLLLFSSGVGGLVVPFLPYSNYSGNGATYFWPIDLWNSQINIFFTALQSPHLIFSLALELLILFFLFLSLNYNNWRYSILSGILGLIFFQFHPYHLPTIILILFIYLIFILIFDFRIFWSNLKLILLFFIICSPALFYHFWLLYSNPSFAGKASQNITLLPPLIYVILGFGFNLIFSLGGIYLWLKNFRLLKEDKKWLFILIWFFVNLILILPKTQFQGRYVQPWIVPMIIFTSYFLFTVYNYFKKRNQLNFLINNPILLTFLAVIIFSFSNFFIYIQDLIYFRQYFQYFYINNDLKQIILQVKKEDLSNKIFLAKQNNSLFLASLARQKVFWGHGHETLNFENKRTLVNNFFTTYSVEQRIKFLKKNKIDYLFWGEDEEENVNFNPQQESYLKLVFKNNQAAIYEVVY